MFIVTSSVWQSPHTREVSLAFLAFSFYSYEYSFAQKSMQPVNYCSNYSYSLLVYISSYLQNSKNYMEAGILLCWLGRHWSDTGFKGLWKISFAHVHFENKQTDEKAFDLSFSTFRIMFCFLLIDWNDTISTAFLLFTV